KKQKATGTVVVVKPAYGNGQVLGLCETTFLQYDVHSSRAVSQDIFTSLFECTPVKVDAILGGIDFDELPELKQSDLQILQDIQEKEQNQNTSTGDEKQCPTSSLSKDTLESGKLESNTIRESRTEVWGSIAGSSRDSQETIISDKTRDDAEEKSFLKKEVRTNSTLNESSLQCLSPSLSFESEDSGSTKDSEDSQSQKSYKSKKKAPAAKKKKVMLDDFLWQLLQDEKYIAYIQWTLKERLEFKFSRPEMVAKLWGDFKNRKRMTYEKLSRGLRYYYHSKKLERIQHKHYHFRFLQRSLDEI
ncbi:protein c-ets-1-B-like, partial [Rhopilema esculentum]|uniref:protein c-ets-1-B-like n=1 Tax=Rhopilema esculentum TaxID=499914 RepID=UPI0031CDE03E